MARNSGFGHSNPVFDRAPAFTRTAHGAPVVATPSAEQLQGMYEAPSAQVEPRMTLDDVIVKCAITFGILIATAATVFYLVPALAGPAWVIGMIGGLALGLVIAFKQSTNPAVILPFAVFEGLLVGGISRTLETFVTVQGESGIVSHAVLGTLAAVVGMFVAYSTGTVRATPKFTRMLITAGFAYLAVAVASLLFAVFTQTPFGFYGFGPLGILLCVLGVALASFFLILDFDFIERGIRNELPARYSWLAAAGLMMTIVWLYVEILRLLAILRGGD
jgi:uncharacterized YccA/Bax inhibitor family protein